MAAPKRKRVMGRPRHPASEKLVAYGLHLSPDKKNKLVQVKDFEGVSIREWIEDHIERDYLAMLDRIAEHRADRRAAS